LASGNTTQGHDTYVHQFIDCPPYRNHIGLKRILNHRALGQNFLVTARSSARPDLIHVGNVPIALAHATVRYGQQVGCPVVIDIRDLWPDIYADLLPPNLAILRPPVTKVLHASALRLKWAFRNASALTALTEPYLHWGLRIAGRPRSDRDAVFAMCYPRRDGVPPDSDLAALRERLGICSSDRLAAYMGNLGYQSDFKTVIEAARLLRVRFPGFKVVLAGSGPRERDLRDAAASLDNVIVPGWLQGPEIAALLHLSSVGLIPFHPVPNFLKNIPNKYSEYLAGGLAIACGLDGEMARLTAEADCGFRYPHGNAAALADGLAKCLADPERLDKMCANARALHAARFDGAHIYPAFADHLEELAGAYALQAAQ
jgi:glycosyltransferase involved in cell wall biosynthesis